MGLVMGSLALGRAVAPFTSGILMTEANILLTQDYSVTQPKGLFSRGASDLAAEQPQRCPYLWL